ncbi:hypothetical protein BHM03_00041949 [Ensete ventricosum]|nr:hypothetical protein BHM03_00041949 [Ensete ventricosum]
MSQERPPSNPNSKHPGGFTYVLPPTLQTGGQAPRFPAEEANVMAPTPNRYQRLFNDPGFTPPASNLGPPAVSVEAFLSLTQHVQTLAGMVQIIIPYIPQLAQALAHQRPDAPRQTPQQGIPQSSLTRGEQPDNGGPRRLSTEVMVENLNTSVMQPASCSWNVIHVPTKLDAISSDSTDSVGEQLRQVNQRLDEVQREFVKSKEEIGESSKGGSPFVPEI